MTEPAPVAPSAPLSATPPPKEPPRAEIIRRRWSWTWLIPLAAAALAGILAWQAWSQRGRIITIAFSSGDGLEEGDPVTYRGVQIGEVHAVRLAPGLSAVEVAVELERDADSAAVEGSAFWIVRPEVSLTRISGLETILGPRYIEVRPGSGPKRSRFTGLDSPPEQARDAPHAPGLELVLQTERRGSLTAGSAITYRGIRVGSIRDLGLAADGRSVTIHATVEDRYAPLVRSNSRFWQVDGLGVDFGILRGLSVTTGSLETIVAGEIAFATPTRAGSTVEDGKLFIVEARPEESWLEWSPDLGPPP